MLDVLYRVRGLKVVFPDENGLIRAVEGIDLDIPKGKCVALVGESGCGKSVTALALMKLLPVPPALISVNEMTFKGVDISGYIDREMEEIRGNRLSMVFQEPMTALNPVMTVGRQIDEVLIRHNKVKPEDARQHSIELLKEVGVPAPEKRYSEFAHQLSGGMRQRVLIAMAFACEPDLLIADEPTTALDVTIQAQIIDLIKDLSRNNQMSILLITHDLGVVANMADIVYVMYSGKIVEQGTVEQLFQRPLHPYTQGLINSVPSLEGSFGERFIQIPHAVPHPIKKPQGCYFHPRCDYATDQCRLAMPALEQAGENRAVRCWNYRERRQMPTSP